MREGECGGSKGTSGIYTIHAKLFNSVLSKRFSKIFYLSKKKKEIFRRGRRVLGSVLALTIITLVVLFLQSLFFFSLKKKRDVGKF